MAGFDPVTLAMAKKYSDSQRIAYEDNKSVTFSYRSGDVIANVTEIVGLEVVDTCPGRMLLTTPNEKPNKEGVLLSEDGLRPRISYSTFGGLINKPCLILEFYLQAYCPSFFKNNTIYDGLVYAFEEVTDTMGMGLTFSKGWHAVCSSNFANEPFDPEVYPFVFNLSKIEDFAQPDTKEYVKGLFVLNETITFTVAAENIYDVYHGGENSSLLVSFTNILDDSLDYGSYHSTIGLYAMEARLSRDGTRAVFNRPNNDGGSTTVIYEKTIHPIDPKFLPGGFEKTMLYDGSPTKMDLSVYGIGTLYLLDTKNLLPMAGGQDIYYEYTANGKTVTGVLDIGDTDGNGNIISMFRRDTESTKIVRYQVELGGLGFGSVDENNDGIDLGNIHLKLWTEYSQYGTYIIRVCVNNDVANIDHEKCCNSIRSGNVCVKNNSYSQTVIRSVVIGEEILLNVCHVVDDSVKVEEYRFINGIYQKS